MKLAIFAVVVGAIIVLGAIWMYASLPTSSRKGRHSVGVAAGCAGQTDPEVAAARVKFAEAVRQVRADGWVAEGQPVEPESAVEPVAVDPWTDSVEGEPEPVEVPWTSVRERFPHGIPDDVINAVQTPTGAWDPIALSLPEAQEESAALPQWRTMRTVRGVPALREGWLMESGMFEQITPSPDAVNAAERTTTDEILGPDRPALPGPPVGVPELEEVSS